MQKPFAIYYNPIAGKGFAERILAHTLQYLQWLNLEVEVFNLSNLPESLEKYDTVLLLGGDGTYNFFLNLYKQIPIPIAFIRGGTGNDFLLHEFGKISLESQLKIAVGKKTKQIDIGICNNKLFLNGAGIGFDGMVTKNSLGKKIFKGKAAYMSTIIPLIFFYREPRYSFSFNGKTVEGRMLMLTIANGSSFGGGIKVAPNAQTNDNLLEFLWIDKLNPIKRIINLPKIEVGKHLNLPYVHADKIREINIKASKKVYAHLDGELFQASEFNIKLLPNYLTIKIK